jgi:hypothetical protein
VPPFGLPGFSSSFGATTSPSDRGFPEGDMAECSDMCSDVSVEDIGGGATADATLGKLKNMVSDNSGSSRI